MILSGILEDKNAAIWSAEAVKVLRVAAGSDVVILEVGTHLGKFDPSYQSFTAWDDPRQCSFGKIGSMGSATGP